MLLNITHKYANKNVRNTVRTWTGYPRIMSVRLKHVLPKHEPIPKEREVERERWWDSLHLPFYPWTDEMSHWQFNSEFLYTISYWLHYKVMISIPHAVSSPLFLFILNLCFMDPDSASRSGNNITIISISKQSVVVFIYLLVCLFVCFLI